ncbi:hypothetical protein P152DRAFT_455578 [Eremomyces bilateralis CBS 781.70]|uniref:Dipeptidase n=1 Tax=Eremomyces bilateralis CBS 781.70 TaxID=1392243 RepID=A0A6G1GCV0_9PEZI|nr:uncharacterized protein P152DRAFT_455578 [Eremomyces bilateralis CBS 781.70]KAF1815864.1 hypothetical protein P152DRAFT_455578 [Eremomyces bilateralis CBS 781.70]
MEYSRFGDADGINSIKPKAYQGQNAGERRSWGTWVSPTKILLLILGAFAIVAYTFGLVPPACSRRNLSIPERARRILKEHPLIDGHNDLMILIRFMDQSKIYTNEFKEKFENGGLHGHVDLPRLDTGMVGGSFWSAFWPCPTNGSDFSDENYDPIVRATLSQLDLYQRLGAAYPHYFTPSTSYSSALHAFSSGNLISPAAIEGLHQIGNRLSTLRLYYSLGVRYATLTWNCHNAYADAALVTNDDGDTVKSSPLWGGISPNAGRALIQEMNRLGMIVDLSHVSVDTMRDVLEGKVGDGKIDGWTGSLAPPIFSHSSAYAICPHPRNVPDDVLQLVKRRGSVVMINFSPDFIACKESGSSTGLPDSVPEDATLQQVVKHIKHIGELIGYEHVGLGSDFDGLESTPKGLEDVSKYPKLVETLLEEGLTEEQLAGIVGRNVLRVWKETEQVAEELSWINPLEDDLEQLQK